MLAQRPTTINEATWEFLVRQLRQTSQAERPSIFSALGYTIPNSWIVSNCLPIIADKPLPFLLHIGFMKQPDLLRGSVITDSDSGLAYRISADAARDIVNQKQSVGLVQLHGGETVVFSSEKFQELLTCASNFHQLNNTNLERWGVKGLQQVANHFAIGKIIAFEDSHPWFKIETLKGHFVLHERDEMGTQGDLIEQNYIESAFGLVEPVMCQKVGEKNLKFTHKFGKYYSASKLKEVDSHII